MLRVTLLFTLLLVSLQLIAAQYDYFTLSEQWGVTFCRIQDCRATNPRRFSIHGFWPTTPEPPYPAYCRDVNFSPSAIASLEDELNSEWPSYNPDGTNEEFWEYEYDKHGSCSLDNTLTNTQLKYFQQSLNLHETYNIDDVLNASGIVASDTKMYSKTELNNIFRAAWGVIPTMDCSTVGGKPLLYEVRPCFTKAAMKPMDCEDAVTTASDAELDFQYKVAMMVQQTKAITHTVQGKAATNTVIRAVCPSQFLIPDSY